MSCTLRLNVYFRLLCAVGLLLSYYSYMVEVKIEEDENYVAMCDISEHISCTKAFSSGYGRGFGIIGSIFGEDSLLNVPNSCYGIVFYSLCLYFSYTNKPTMIRVLYLCCFASNFMSLYLAYILYFILSDLCIICAAMYIVNAMLTYFAYCKLKLVKTDTIHGTVTHSKTS